MNQIILDNQTIYPSKVLCIGRNYTEHIKELNNETPDEMVFFIKPNSAISNKILFPKGHSSCHYESELSFLIEENKITAVAFGLDMTLREVQSVLKKKGLPWERAKAFDSSAIFTKFVPILESEISKLSLELHLNGELKQKGGYSLMINKPLEIIKEANNFLSFEDGDILMSGTPKGVGEFKVGDIFLCRVLLGEKIIIEESFKVL